MKRNADIYPPQVDRTFYETVKKTNQRKTPVSRVSCASPNQTMTRRLMPPYGVATLVRVLTIIRLLRASLHWGALPDSMMLASLTGLCGRRARKLASLKQVRALIPSDASMLGEGQRDKNGSPTD